LQCLKDLQLTVFFINNLNLELRAKPDLDTDPDPEKNNLGSTTVVTTTKKPQVRVAVSE
jgi:hypothetical protein